MKIDIVTGLQYGDEGKGNITNALSTSESLVVQYNGGHQKGHTVIEDGIRHVFSSFGAGTLKGASSMISHFCTIYPPAILNEMRYLTRLPILSIHPDAMLTTPFDIASNKSDSNTHKHGTTGYGFGQTVKRHELYPLYARDMKYPHLLRIKLKLIYKNFYRDCKSMEDIDNDIDIFISNCNSVYNTFNIADYSLAFSGYEHIVLEGSQGVMLDQNHGFFPHVTRSNTTIENAISIIEERGLLNPDNITINMVSRCYQSRHGNGPLPYGELELVDIEPVDETNKKHEYQGEPRYAPLDINSLAYAIDITLSKSKVDCRNNLFITCIDQATKPRISAILNGVPISVNFKLDNANLPLIDNVIPVRTPSLVLFEMDLQKM